MLLSKERVISIVRDELKNYKFDEPSDKKCVTALMHLLTKLEHEPVVPKFRIGDEVKFIGIDETFTVTDVRDDAYYSEDLLICRLYEEDTLELADVDKSEDERPAKFKVGDKICHINSLYSGYFIVDEIKEDGYYSHGTRICKFNREDFWELATSNVLPKFIVGEVIYHKKQLPGTTGYTIEKITADSYITENGSILIDNQDDYETRPSLEVQEYPKFKVGDVIFYKNQKPGTSGYTISEVTPTKYIFDSGESIHIMSQKYYVLREDNSQLTNNKLKFEVGDVVNLDTCEDTKENLLTISDIRPEEHCYVCHQGSVIDFLEQDNWHLVFRPKFKKGEEVIYLNEHFIVEDITNHYILSNKKEHASVSVLHIEFESEEMLLSLKEKEETLLGDEIVKIENQYHGFDSLTRSDVINIIKHFVDWQKGKTKHC